MESHVFVANDQYRTKEGGGGGRREEKRSFPSAGNFVSAVLARWNYEIMQNMFHARFKFNGRGGNAKE